MVNCYALFHQRHCIGGYAGYVLFNITSLDIEVFISAIVSSLTLLMHKRKDLNIMKVVLYPRAIESLYTLLKE